MDATDGAARIVRLPGIYGPGRSPFGKLRNGKAHRAVKPGQVFSRVHVDDIARGLEALFDRPHLYGVFHLCDDLPAPPQDVTAFAANLLQMTPPPEVPFEAAGLSPMAKSFYAECKRVSNARAKAALGWRPLYPTYREGLRAVLAAEDGR
jgi:nucleoside-diphosphate-sugar epimerase